MKKWAISVIATTLLAATTATSQPPDRPPGQDRPRGAGELRGPKGHRPPGRAGMPHAMGLFGVLDADGDGMLSAEEIAAAPQVLARLDQNQDGNVTFQEAHRGTARTASASRGGPPRQDVQRPGANPRGLAPPGRPRSDRPRGGDDDVLPGQRSPRSETDRPWGPMMVERLMNLDADEDGKLSREELPERIAHIFDQIDTNQDGFVDADELTAFGERMRDRGPAGRRPNRPQRERDTDETTTSDAV